MTRWEYLIIDKNMDHLSNEYFDTLGDRGWELVHGASRGANVHQFFFKRPLPEKKAQ